MGEGRYLAGPEKVCLRCSNEDFNNERNQLYEELDGLDHLSKSNSMYKVSREELVTELKGDGLFHFKFYFHVFDILMTILSEKRNMNYNLLVIMC